MVKTLVEQITKNIPNSNAAEKGKIDESSQERKIKAAESAEETSEEKKSEDEGRKNEATIGEAYTDAVE